MTSWQNPETFSFPIPLNALLQVGVDPSRDATDSSPKIIGVSLNLAFQPDHASHTFGSSDDGIVSCPRAKRAAAKGKNTPVTAFQLLLFEAPKWTGHLCNPN